MSRSKSIGSFRKWLFVILVFSTSLTLTAQNEGDSTVQSLNALEGTWLIDLRPTPDSEPYLKEFKFKLKTDSVFEGEFYESPIYNGLLNKNWEKVYFAFYTRDSNNEYYHSGYWDGDKIYGMTYCRDRDFVAPWVGTKKE